LQDENKEEKETLFYEPSDHRFSYLKSLKKFRKVVIAIVAVNRLAKKYKPQLDHKEITKTISTLFPSKTPDLATT
jgi:hypothetical protein